LKFSKTHLKGLYVIDTEPFVDERGQFFRTFCKKEFAEIGHTKEFVQINHSINKFKGTFRGFHYQIPPFKEIKVVRCISGKVLDIIIDIRKNSDTFLQHYQIELSEENKKMIYIPEGFAHGFITLEDNSQLIYYHSSFYVPNFEGGLRFDDDLIDINFPIEPKIISDRDNNFSLITDAFIGI